MSFTFTKIDGPGGYMDERGSRSRPGRRASLMSKRTCGRGYFQGKMLFLAAMSAAWTVHAFDGGVGVTLGGRFLGPEQDVDENWRN